MTRFDSLTVEEQGNHVKRQLDWLLRSAGCKILFEDNEVIVLNEPANLLVLPDRYNETLNNLYSLLNEELEKSISSTESTKKRAA